MVASVMFNKAVKLNMNKGRFYVPNQDNKIISIKDIPAVRYRLGTIGEDNLAFIKKAMDIFTWSVHIAEVRYEEITDELMQFIESSEHLAWMLIVDVRDSDITGSEIGEGVMNPIRNMVEQGYMPDRIILEDNTTKMDQLALENVINAVAKVSKYKKDEIGVCNSPWSYGENPCLSAVVIRQLGSLYCDNDDMALPNCNHSSMNECGCARFFRVDEDLRCPAENKVEKPKKEKTVKVKTDGVDEFEGQMNLPGIEPKVADSKPKREKKVKGLDVWNSFLRNTKKVK